MNEKEIPDNKDFSIEELVDLFGDDQESLNAAVTVALENPDEKEREEKIKTLKIVAERARLNFPTDADIQRKKAEFARDEISRN